MDNIEDLIQAIKHGKAPDYIRKGWIISARSKIMKADRELQELEKKHL